MFLTWVFDFCFSLVIFKLKSYFCEVRFLFYPIGFEFSPKSVLSEIISVYVKQGYLFSLWLGLFNLTFAISNSHLIFLSSLCFYFIKEFVLSEISVLIRFYYSLKISYYFIGLKRCFKDCDWDIDVFNVCPLFFIFNDNKFKL